jgi:hypothetical protein
MIDAPMKCRLAEWQPGSQHSSKRWPASRLGLDLQTIDFGCNGIHDYVTRFATPLHLIPGFDSDVFGPPEITSRAFFRNHHCRRVVFPDVIDGITEA